MAFLRYNAILAVLSPAVAGGMAYRVWVSGKARRSWKQQIGLVSVPEEMRQAKPIWIHAVSVGESVASAMVVTELKKLLSGRPIVVSTTTQTGQDMACKSVQDADAFIYYPLDLLPCVNASVDAVNPGLFASTDTEIWPNFRHVLKSRGIPNAIINGVVSDKTMRGAKRLGWMYRWALSNIDLFCMQSAGDADRVISIGAPAERVIVTGNCKADQSTEPMSPDDAAKLRISLGFPEDAPVFVAGSTNPGEDEPVIDAFIAARRTHPQLRLVIAPRQLDRAGDIRSLVESRGLTCALRSEGQRAEGREQRAESGDTSQAPDVLVLDTMGELANVYAAGVAAFVGGTLIPKGGHSLLQPIAQGKPVLFGPHTFKTKDIAAQSKSYGCGIEVNNADELGRKLAVIVGSFDLQEDYRLKCAQMMAANRGASARTARALVELLNRTKAGDSAD